MAFEFFAFFSVPFGLAGTTNYRCDAVSAKRLSGGVWGGGSPPSKNGEIFIGTRRYVKLGTTRGAQLEMSKVPAQLEMRKVPEGHSASTIRNECTVNVVIKLQKKQNVVGPLRGSAPSPAFDEANEIHNVVS